MKRRFLVELEMPSGALVEDIREYIEYAVQAWRGSLHPEDPIFDLDPDKVVCRAQPNKRKGRKRKR